MMTDFKKKIEDSQGNRVEGTIVEIEESIISHHDVNSQQGIKFNKGTYISNKQQSWANECFRELESLDVMAGQEGLPPPDSQAKAFAEKVLSSLVKFSDPFPRPQIFVDDDKVIVFYFVWQCSFVSLNIWSDKIWCLSTINSERRECLSPPEKRDNVVTYFFQELRRLLSDASREES